MCISGRNRKKQRKSDRYNEEEKRERMKGKERRRGEVARE